MANIVSSKLSASVQKDGRSIVNEVHTDDLGLKWDITYLADDKADLNAAMAQHAVDMGANLIAAEVGDNIAQIIARGSLVKPSLKYSVIEDTISAAREAYRTATETTAVMIGDYLDTLSSEQLQAAFKMTDSEVKTLREKSLTPAATLAASIRSTVGVDQDKDDAIEAILVIGGP